MQKPARRSLHGACRCVQVTDAGFEEVAKGCRNLQELRLYACSGVTDRALAAVGTLARLRVRVRLTV